MATTRPTPSVVVLTVEDLTTLMAQVTEGFNKLNARLDDLEEKVTKPGLDKAQLRKEIANAALKAATTRPAVKRTPRS
jgi:hypothetical protein